VARIAVGGLASLFVFTTLYVAHARRAKGLDVGVVGTAAQATQLQSALDVRARGAFDARRYDSVARVRAAPLDIAVHEVVVPGDRVLVAGASGVMLTQTGRTRCGGGASFRRSDDTVSGQAGVTLSGRSTVLYNQIAAVPSLHVGSAVAVGVALAVRGDAPPSSPSCSRPWWSPSP